eukprot:GHVT01084002.1.p1 GENE.GHVT01084002.1~~GHVT01084002.1.p1  ORF type:complete len:586 (-),score=29.26 GHVT01084002.1:1150-2907(-)
MKIPTAPHWRLGVCVVIIFLCIALTNVGGSLAQLVNENHYLDNIDSSSSPSFSDASSLVAARSSKPSECYCPKGFSRNGTTCIKRSHSQMLDTCPFDLVPKHDSKCLQPLPSGPYCEQGAKFVPKVGCVASDTVAPINRCSGICSTLQLGAANFECPFGAIFDEESRLCTEIQKGITEVDCAGDIDDDGECTTKQKVDFTLSCPVGWRLENHWCVRVEHAKAIRHCADEERLLLTGAHLVRHEEDHCIFQTVADQIDCSKHLDVYAVPSMAKQQLKSCVSQIKVTRIKECPKSFTLVPDQITKASIIRGEAEHHAHGHDAEVMEEAHDLTSHTHKLECYRTRVLEPDFICAGTVDGVDCFVTMPQRKSYLCPEGGPVVDGHCLCQTYAPPQFFCEEGSILCFPDSVNPLCGEFQRSNDPQSFPEAAKGSSPIDHTHLLDKPFPACAFRGDSLSEYHQTLSNRQVEPICVRQVKLDYALSCPDNYVAQNGHCVSNTISKPRPCPQGAIFVRGNCYLEVPFIRQCPLGHVSIDSTDLCIKQESHPQICPHLRGTHLHMHDLNSPHGHTSQAEVYLEDVDYASPDSTL